VRMRHGRCRPLSLGSEEGRARTPGVPGNSRDTARLATGCVTVAPKGGCLTRIVEPDESMLSLGVVTAPGLEPIALREMQDLAVDGEIEETGLIVARGNLATLMRLNLHLRTATRVLVRAAQFHA